MNFNLIKTKIKSESSLVTLKFESPGTYKKEKKKKKKKRIVPFGMNLLNECPELNLIVVGCGLLIENTTGPENCFLRKKKPLNMIKMD
jgi:hypothetical protein